MKYECYFDGACEPINPGGTIGVGVYIKGELPDQIFKYSKTIPASTGNTNNVAEYLGIIKIFELMSKKTDCEIIIRGDSKMVINQMKGEWKIKKGLYYEYALKAQKLFEELSKKNKITLIWIPREQNELADELSKPEGISKEELNKAISRRIIMKEERTKKRELKEKRKIVKKKSKKKPLTLAEKVELRKKKKERWKKTEEGIRVIRGW